MFCIKMYRLLRILVPTCKERLGLGYRAIRRNSSLRLDGKGVGW
jgi:hypothetical protein